jgi:hypothetical protein
MVLLVGGLLLAVCWVATCRLDELKQQEAAARGRLGLRLADVCSAWRTVRLFRAEKYHHARILHSLD